MHGLTRIYKPNLAYHRAGIFLLNIVPTNSYLPDLLADKVKIEQRKILSETVDQINLRFSKDTLSLGASTFKDRHWAMCQSRKSLNYLSSWNEILRFD